MTTERLISLDLLLTVTATAAWLGAGATAAARRPRAALALLGVAAVATAGRIGCVIALAGAGWWFVQEKLTLTMPLLGVAGLAAAVLAGPRLLRAARQDGQDTAGLPGSTVALLTAGYAGAAGLVVTLLHGYPATWSVALLTVAIVSVAALVTWRIVVPAGPLSALRVPAAAVLAMALVGVGLAIVPAGGTDTGGALAAAHSGHDMSMDQPAAPGTLVTALHGPATPAEGGTVRRFTLTARTATITLSSGRQVAAWTFDGQVPGPQISATQGDLIEVTLHNADIAAGVTLHWHGYDVPGGEDGVPGLTQEAVLPGQDFGYRFLASQVGSYWYHTHEVSDRGVAMGLFGSLVVTPRGAPTLGLDLTLPVHTFSGTTVLGDHDQVIRQMAAPGTPVRLRLVNTDNVPHRLTLAGSPYRLVATDGADVTGPGDLTRVGLRLPAAGRYDLAFTMPANPVALLVDDDRGGGLRLTSGGAAGSVAVDDTAAWPELDLTSYGTPSATPFDLGSRFDRHFTVVLDRGLGLVNGRPIYAYTVNGLAFPSIPTQIVRENDLVRMTVVNRSSDTHPWHLHGHHVLVLARNGHAPTGSPLWLDTFDVRPGEVWEVAFRATNPGLWMNHCHNLAHADQGMALHLAYEGITAPFHGAHGAHGG